MVIDWKKKVRQGKALKLQSYKENMSLIKDCIEFLFSEDETKTWCYEINTCFREGKSSRIISITRYALEKEKAAHYYNMKYVVFTG